jgi:hypothetical protein
MKRLQDEPQVARLERMKQASLGLNLNTKRTRKRLFLQEMKRVVRLGSDRGTGGTALPQGGHRPPPDGHRGDAARSLPAAVVRLE